MHTPMFYNCKFELALRLPTAGRQVEADRLIRHARVCYLCYHMLILYETILGLDKRG